MHTNNAANFALKVHFILKKRLLQTTIKPNFTCNRYSTTVTRNIFKKDIRRRRGR